MKKTTVVGIIVVTAVVLFITRIVLKRTFSRYKTGISMHMLKHPSWYEGDFPEDHFRPSMVNQKRFSAKVSTGYKTMSRSRIVITGLARDISKNVGKNIDRLVRIGSKFFEYQILIFENDSSDDTRTIIKQKGKRNPNIKLIQCPEEENCRLNLKKAVDDGIISSGRFHKMAQFRNRYLQMIRSDYSHYDYFMVVDMDLSGPISVDGLATCFSYVNWHAMSAMGLVSKPLSKGTRLSYYDSLAYVPFGGYPSDNSYLSTLYQFVMSVVKLFRYHTIKTFTKAVPDREEKPQLVSSGFAGCCLYRIEPFISAPDISYSGEHCEHVTLHLRMIEHGYNQIYINPAFLLLHSISVSETSKNKFEKMIGI